MSWFVKKRLQKTAVEEKTVRVPEGLWIKCDACEAVLYRSDLERNLHVCPKCAHHNRISARERLDGLLDLFAGGFQAQAKLLAESGEQSNAIPGGGCRIRNPLQAEIERTR